MTDHPPDDATPPEPAGDAPACDFCKWIDYGRTGWVARRPGCYGFGYQLCGFCDVSATVDQWHTDTTEKPAAIIDQMRGFNILRDEISRQIDRLVDSFERTAHDPPVSPPHE